MNKLINVSQHPSMKITSTITYQTRVFERERERERERGERERVREREIVCVCV